MPIYEYECAHCAHRLEALQKVSDDALVECPVCHASALQKLVSASSFQLKGTGWYATDFRNKGKAPEKTEKSTDTASDSNKTDTKSDVKTPPSSTDTAA